MRIAQVSFKLREECMIGQFRKADIKRLSEAANALSGEMRYTCKTFNPPHHDNWTLNKIQLFETNNQSTGHPFMSR